MRCLLVLIVSHCALHTHSLSFLIVIVRQCSLYTHIHTHTHSLSLLVLIVTQCALNANTHTHFSGINRKPVYLPSREAQNNFGRVFVLMVTPFLCSSDKQEENSSASELQTRNGNGLHRGCRVCIAFQSLVQLLGPLQQASHQPPCPAHNVSVCPSLLLTNHSRSGPDHFT